VTVDAHHHLWDPSVRPYPWMTGEAAALARPRGLDDLRDAVTGTDVTATVVVQAVHETSETLDLLAAAATGGGLVRGVVGWVDLTTPDIPHQVARLRESDGGHLLVGIRHQVHDEEDAGWLCRPEVVAGLRALAGAGLVFDLLVRPRELPAALAAVRAVPDLAFVLDHAAKPAIADGAREPWAHAVAALAAEPNVTCKLSGLVTEASQAWTVEALRPYAAHVCEVFGPSRLMFGSDWPVCTLRATYAEVRHAADALLEGLSPDERDDVLAGTARRVYGC